MDSTIEHFARRNHHGVNETHNHTVSTGSDNVAFLNPDGTKVLVAYDESATPIRFGVDSSGRYFTYIIPAQAMATLTWR
jgi:glucosylceramidase